MTFINHTQNLNWDLQQTLLVSFSMLTENGIYVSFFYKLQPSYKILLNHLASSFSNIVPFDSILINSPDKATVQ